MDNQTTNLANILRKLETVAERTSESDPERAEAISKAEDILLQRYLAGGTVDEY